MNTIQCSTTSRRALSRVLSLSSPLERSEPSLQRQLLPLVHRRSPRPSSARLRFQFHHTRTFVSQTPRSSRFARGPPPPEDAEDEDTIYDKRYTTKESIIASGRGRHPKDHEIPDPKIMVIRDGNISGPLLTRNVLARLDESESLRMVKTWVPPDRKEGVPAQYAMCKIVNKKEEYLREREAEERTRLAKEASKKTKVIVVSWGIGDNDLEFKMRMLGEFVAKGYRVEVRLSKKKRANRIKVDEAQAKTVLDKVLKLVEPMDLKSYRDAWGQINWDYHLYYEKAGGK